jgi:uncharacterized protein YigA (DUF484 family)
MDKDNELRSLQALGNATAQPNATTSATEAQPTGLKALAGKVLERNQQRNQSATKQLRGATSSATDPSATEAEIRRLVATIYAQDTAEDQAEALQHALAHPEEALRCYRWMLSPDYQEYQRRRTLH